MTAVLWCQPFERSRSKTAWLERRSRLLLKAALYCFSLLTRALWDLAQIWFKKSTNNIQMVPRLSTQLCTKEWQLQQNHDEFFMKSHCVSPLTPSWALSARPESCLLVSDIAPSLAAVLAYTKHSTQSLIHSFILHKKTTWLLDALN